MALIPGVRVPLDSTDYLMNCNRISETEEQGLGRTEEQGRGSRDTEHRERRPVPFVIQQDGFLLAVCCVLVVPLVGG